MSHQHGELIPETAISQQIPDPGAWDVLAPQSAEYRKNEFGFDDVSASLPTLTATSSTNLANTTPDYVKPRPAVGNKFYICELESCRARPFGDRGDLRRHRLEMHGIRLLYCPIPTCKRHTKGFALVGSYLAHRKQHPPEQLSNTVLTMICSSQKGNYPGSEAPGEEQCPSKVEASSETTVIGDMATSSGGPLRENRKELSALRNKHHSNMTSLEEAPRRVVEEVKVTSPETRRGGRHVESIRIYADSEVSALLEDVEEEINRMGEQGEQHERERTERDTVANESLLKKMATDCSNNPAGQDKLSSKQPQPVSRDNDCFESETESQCWDEELNSTESTVDDSDRYGEFDELADNNTPWHIDSLEILNPLLTSAKQQLVKSIMKEFWIIFNQDWAGNVQKCTGFNSVSETGSSPCSHPNSPSRDQGSQKSQKSTKRREEHDPDDDPDDNDQRGSKRFKKGPVDLDRPRYNFACPYRKHNPRKYCVQSTWRSCALTPLENVARVK
jgi:hypothetical protein